MSGERKIYESFIRFKKPSYLLLVCLSIFMEQPSNSPTSEKIIPRVFIWANEKIYHIKKRHLIVDEGLSCKRKFISLNIKLIKYCVVLPCISYFFFFLYLFYCHHRYKYLPLNLKYLIFNSRFEEMFVARLLHK